MARTGTLCTVCTSIIYPSSNVDLVTTTSEYQIHHETVLSLLNAAKSGCTICSIAWDNLKSVYDDRDLSAHCGKFSTLYRLYPYDGQKVRAIEILYHGLQLPSRISGTRFRLLSLDDPRFETLLYPPSIGTETASTATIDLAFDWYRSCLRCHSLCKHWRQQSNQCLPSRLLDIGLPGEPQWNLLLTSEHGLQPCSALYMTLSYRWGRQESLGLLNSTIDAFRAGLPICDLPQAFQDAIAVTRRFHIRYLWIDALCIVQDCREDWEREVPRMRSVYMNSACNIAASASDDPYGGLFRTRDPSQVKPKLISAPSPVRGNSPDYCVIDKSYWNRQLSGGSLHKRGWEFQERLLAPRVLYFCKSQVSWECFTDLKCESFPHGIPYCNSTKNLEPLWRLLQHKQGRGQADAKMPLPVLHLWNGLVKEYSKCALTWASDKLPAISGVAKLFEDVTDDEYLAGLWRSRLLEQLDWWVEQPCTRFSSDFRAPTWSWASVDGPVRLRSQATESHFLVSFQRVVVEQQFPDSSVVTPRMRLVLEGNLIMAPALNGSLKNIIHPDTLEIEFDGSRPVFFLPLQRSRREILSATDDEDEAEVQEVSCLLLEAVLCTTPVSFRRVGHCVLESEGDMSALGLGHAGEQGLGIGDMDNLGEVTVL